MLEPVRDGIKTLQAVRAGHSPRSIVRSCSITRDTCKPVSDLYAHGLWASDGRREFVPPLTAAVGLEKVALFQTHERRPCEHRWRRSPTVDHVGVHATAFEFLPLSTG